MIPQTLLLSTAYWPTVAMQGFRHKILGQQSMHHYFSKNKSIFVEVWLFSNKIYKGFYLHTIAYNRTFLWALTIQLCRLLFTPTDMKLPNYTLAFRFEILVVEWLNLALLRKVWPFHVTYELKMLLCSFNFV